MFGSRFAYLCTCSLCPDCTSVARWTSSRAHGSGGPRAGGPSCGRPRSHAAAAGDLCHFCAAACWQPWRLGSGGRPGHACKHPPGGHAGTRGVWWARGPLTLAHPKATGRAALSPPRRRGALCRVLGALELRMVGLGAAAGRARGCPLYARQTVLRAVSEGSYLGTDIAAAMSPPWRGVTTRPHRIEHVCPGSKNCECICAKGTGWSCLRCFSSCFACFVSLGPQWQLSKRGMAFFLVTAPGWGAPLPCVHLCLAKPLSLPMLPFVCMGAALPLSADVEGLGCQYPVCPTPFSRAARLCGRAPCPEHAALLV